MNAERPADVLDLSKSDVKSLRDIYFTTVNEHLILKPETMFIDKFPLNIAFSSVLHNIFPDAKFIFALRHPCDACLSCFMHGFRHNSAMANFSTIEDTTSLYVKLMGNWEHHSKAENINFHRIRYEDLIENFQYEIKQLLGFLELDWDDAVNAHTENARNRGIIDTPSYDQVTEPLYKRAMYRWTKYESLFEPHLNSLSTYINAYGYQA